MKPAFTDLRRSPIAWSLLWAFAFIATAFFFKGTAAKDWIEAALLVVALTFVTLKPWRTTACPR